MRRQAAVETIRILLVEHEASVPGRVERLLSPLRGATADGPDRFDLTRARSVGEAFNMLEARRAFDIVLLDFDLPEMVGPATLVRLEAAVPDLPVIVFAEGDDDGQALAAMRQGAQDWLPKRDLSTSMLVRAIRHAMVRKQVDVELRRQLRRLQRARSKTQRQAVELRERAKQLDAMNRELDDFIYAASHDLKEPVRGIRAYCELFAEEYESRIDRVGVEQLRAIMAMCSRLETQISDLLTFYRVGRLHPSVARVDLTEIVHGQVTAFRAILDRCNGAIRVKSSLPIVQGHPVLLGMIFANLISNGLKYNRSVRPVVEIGVVSGTPWTIYVRDNGIGIPAAHHENVFELFRRLHGRKEFEGSGAGLTIVRKIIRSYQGRIWLESEPGRGTTFYFTLPAAATEPTRPPHWIAIDGEKAEKPPADEQSTHSTR